jgi:hypothetical protein
MVEWLDKEGKESQTFSGCMLPTRSPSLRALFSNPSHSGGPRLISQPGARLFLSLRSISEQMAE